MQYQIEDVAFLILITFKDTVFRFGSNARFVPIFGSLGTTRRKVNTEQSRILSRRSLSTLSNTYNRKAPTLRYPTRSPHPTTPVQFSLRKFAHHIQFGAEASEKSTRECPFRAVKNYPKSTYYFVCVLCNAFHQKGVLRLGGGMVWCKTDFGKDLGREVRGHRHHMADSAINIKKGGLTDSGALCQTHFEPYKNSKSICHIIMFWIGSPFKELVNKGWSSFIPPSRCLNKGS